MCAAVAVGLIAIAVDVAASGGRSAFFEPALYVALETTAAIAGFIAAYLVFFRFRRSGRLDDLLLADGLAILSLSNLLFGVIPGTLDNTTTRFYSWGLASGVLLGTLIIAFAAVAPGSKLARPKRAAWLLAGYSVVAMGMLAEATTGLAAAFSIHGGTSRGHDAALTMQLILIAVFAFAAIAFLRRAERDGDTFIMWLAVAAALRVFAGIDYAFSPSLDRGWVYTGDAFRIGFYIALLAGAAGEVGRYWQASREAAVLDERRRIARDLHDGLSQELAFIVRRAKRALEGKARPADSVQIAHAAERALDESRRVIATLTRPLDEPLDVVLSEAVKGVADRVGVTVALALDPGVHVSADAREALVRIAREAVTNAARHGDAGLVRVELENGTGLRLRIVDDGRGFDAAATARQRSRGGFGLVSMSERAQAVGGVLHVASERGAGTTVEVELL